MKTTKMFMTVLAALAIAACSNDDTDALSQQFDNSNENAPNAYASFSISIPHDLRTRATSAADAGIAEENKVNSLHVFIYDKEAPYTPTVAEFSVNGGTLKQVEGGTKWVTSQPISTKKTDKYIFAGVNLNNDIIDYITTNGFGAFNYKEFMQDVTKLADRTNGFVMFNDTYPVFTPSANLFDSRTDAENSHISIPVSRVTAKAAVFTSPAFVVNGGGTMTDLKFGWRNINKKFYFMQDKRDAFIKDYNWDTYTKDDFDRGSDAIKVYASAETPASFSYTTENAFQYVPGVSSIDGTTFVSISGVFKPSKVISAKSQDPVAASDFEIVDNIKPVGSTFYVVRTTDGIANYFVDGKVAEKYAELCIKNTIGMPSFQGNYVLSENTYSDGLCYYHLFVNGDAVSPQSPYNVYRNQYFKINVNSIQAPGNPSDNFDAGQPIQTSSWIGADIEIAPWEMIEEDYDI